MAYKLSKRSRGRLDGVSPDIIEVVEEAIVDSPYDFGIPGFGGLRTTEDQQGLYAIGRTVEMGRKPVTYVDGVNKKSNHQARPDGFGHAFDIYIYDHETKRASWNVDKLSEVAQHIKRVAARKGIVLNWGGDWTRFKDYPHFERA